MLGPRLYCIFFKQIGDICENHNMDYHWYADDFQIYIVVLTDLLQRYVHEAHALPLRHTRVEVFKLARDEPRQNRAYNFCPKTQGCERNWQILAFRLVVTLYTIQHMLTRAPPTGAGRSTFSHLILNCKQFTKLYILLTCQQIGVNTFYKCNEFQVNIFDSYWEILIMQKKYPKFLCTMSKQGQITLDIQITGSPALL